MIQQPNRDFPIVNAKGLASDQFQGLIDSICAQLNLTQVYAGTGSPEGILKAAKFTQYQDINGAPGSMLWFKTTDESLNTGWTSIA